MSGVRLEAKIHIVTAAVTSAQNIVKCANKAGLNVIDIVLEPLASAEATLSPDEKELGVALIDFGGGTTDVAVFGDGAYPTVTSGRVQLRPALRLDCVGFELIPVAVPRCTGHRRR